MVKQSAIYVFTRDEQSPNGQKSRSLVSTDAVRAVFTWVGGAGRSYQTMLTQDDFLIARLMFEEDDEEAAEGDLSERCTDWGLKREKITEMVVDKMRAE